MIQLTKRTEYGLIALTYLAAHSGRVVSVREIAEHYPVSRRLLGEALKDLSRSKLVLSQRGANGGYSLGRAASEISIGEVVAIVEGEPTVASCESLGSYVSGSCEVESVCPIRSPIQRLKGDIWELLCRTKLSDLTGNPNTASAPNPASKAV